MDGIITDCFAGGGGASLGIEMALGRSPDIAVNHDPEAVAMHAANHPNTHHLCGDIWDVRPSEACAGRDVALAWFSPDCTHFSRAKGGKPRSKKIRSLAWVVIRWARAVRPSVICVENVVEWLDWGPLLDDNTPDPSKLGFTFRRWLGELKACGYVVEMRALRACDYGAPTTRKRLFVVARCDGQPIVWPSPTHGVSTPLLPLQPYRSAAECIDWSTATCSIFWRAKPLADKTLARIARGVRKYVIESTPFMAPPTDAAHLLIQTGYGERAGQEPRSLDITTPLGTVVAGGAKHALVTAFLAKHYGGHENDGQSLTSPMSTITTQDHHALVTAHLVGDHRGEVRELLSRHGITKQCVVVNGQPYDISDIGMRMLTPRELYRAQGFPESYKIDIEVDGKPLSKSAQIRMVGNSAPPPVVAAIVGANVGEESAVAA